MLTPLSQRALQEGEQIELTIDSLGYGGVGVGRHASGLVCFVGKTLPGERVTARILRRKKRHAVCGLQAVLKPAAERVEPPCVYFSECGGCHYQQLPYAEQLQVKMRILQDNFSRLALPTKELIEPIVGATTALGYRNKSFLHVEQQQIGFVNPLNKSIVPIERCLCAPDTTNQLIASVQEWLRGAGKILTEHLLDIIIRDSETNQQQMIIFVVASESRRLFLSSDKSKIPPAMHSLTEKHPEVSFYLNFKPRQSKSMFTDDFIHIAGSRALNETIGRVTLTLSPGSFVQIHPQQAAALYDRAIHELQPKQDEVVYDLYSGSGALSLLLAGQCREVYAIEQNYQAVLDAQQSAKLNQIENVVFRSGKCETILKKRLRHGHRAVAATINPPRSGCSATIPSLLQQLGVQRLIYISCSPPTLCRDIERLSEQGYRLKKIIPFDMFPQTYHLELIAYFFGTKSNGY